MADLRPYSFEDCSVVIGGVPIRGKIDFEVTFPNEKETIQFDTDGGATASHNSNWLFAHVALKNAYGALSNQECQAFIFAGNKISLTIIDNNATTLYEIPNAIFTKQPDASFTQERGERVWMLKGYCIPNEGTNALG